MEMNILFALPKTAVPKCLDDVRLIALTSAFQKMLLGSLLSAQARLDGDAVFLLRLPGFIQMCIAGPSPKAAALSTLCGH